MSCVVIVVVVFILWLCEAHCCSAAQQRQQQQSCESAVHLDLGQDQQQQQHEQHSATKAGVNKGLRRLLSSDSSMPHLAV
jgi:hypothetical protein